MKINDKNDILQNYFSLETDKSSLEWLEKYIKYINMILIHKPDLDGDTRKWLLEELVKCEKKLDKMEFNIFSEKMTQILGK